MKNQSLENETPRRKRTGYRRPATLANCAASGGELNPKVIKLKPVAKIQTSAPREKN